MKTALSRIRLFIGNVWMILSVDPLHKIIFSFSCAVFSLFIAEELRSSLTKAFQKAENVSAGGRIRYNPVLAALEKAVM